MKIHNLCPDGYETATGVFDPVGYDENDCAGCGLPHSHHVSKTLMEVFASISETNLFSEKFGDGTILTGVSPNDIYQMGYADAFNQCFAAVGSALLPGEAIPRTRGGRK